MSFADLRALFEARSIAVVGASADLSKIGGRPLSLLVRHRFEGRLYAVNPKYERIGDTACFGTVSEIPDTVDLAVVTLPADAVAAAIEDCGHKGVRFAIVFASGFAEMGQEGKMLQKTLIDTARKHRIRLLGPNTIGFVSAPNRVLGTFAPTLGEPGELPAGDVALVSQSGAVSLWSYHWAREQGIDLRHFVAVGNESDLDLADFTFHITADPAVKAIGGYIESFRSDGGIRGGRRFLEAAQTARARGVPICLLKAGTSDVGRRAAASHTGALSGSDRIYDGVLRQCGVTRATEPQQVIDFLQLASGAGRIPRAPGVAIVSLSGGLGAWMADQFVAGGLEVPRLRSETRQRLASVLPPFASVENPVDLTGAIVTEPALVGQSVAAVLKDPEVETVIVLIAFQELTGGRIAEDLARLAAETSKLLTVTWCFGPQDAYRVLSRAKVPTFREPGRCCRAVTSIVRAGVALATPDNGGRPVFESPPAHRRAPRRHGIDTEYGAKALLTSLGIPSPPGGLARTADEAARLAARLGGPLALKVQASGLAHKTELGLIALDVASGDVPAAFLRLVERAAMAGVAADGVLVESIVRDGVETIIGTVDDPVFGPVLMLGAGGVRVETEQQVAFRAIPVGLRDVDEMIAEAGLAPVLEGLRGGPAHDRDALVTAALAVSEYTERSAEWLSGLEINPLRVLPAHKGVVALDALATLRAHANELEPAK
jgi:acetyltransferase